MSRKTNMPISTKKPFYKRWWFWCIIAIFVIGALGSESEVQKVEEVQGSSAQSSSPAAATTSKPNAAQEQTSAATNEAETEGENRIPAKVTKVTDGDTITVEVDGKEEKVRLLLVDTPETVHPSKPVQPFGKEASSFAKDTLDGKDIELELDVSERDKYGRLLAYVWVDGQMFNELLLKEGLARVAYVYAPNVKYVDQFREIQDKARKDEKGIWSIENYATEQGFDEKAFVLQQEPKKIEQNKTPVQPEPKKEEPKAIETKQEVYYKNCTEARNAGAAPLYEGDPGYRLKLDRDKDGVACE